MKHIHIEAFADGSAAWLVQQKTLLTSEDDVAAFWEYLNITSLDDISNYVHSIVDHASIITGRSMRVQSGSITVNANISLVSNEGIFQYQFVWIGFAERMDESKIRIGDALSGEIDLGRDDMLTIKYPIGYSQVLTYPTPDEIQESDDSLTWFGPLDFGAGEPNAIFEKVSFTWVDFILANAGILSVVATALTSGLLGYFIGLKRFTIGKPSRPRIEPEQMSLSLADIKDDKEKVVTLLVSVGGRIPQSAIAKQCGFSKSKASDLLSEMERDGKITRKKLGRGKIVTLVKSENQHMIHAQDKVPRRRN